jgi:hypothetical protein
MKFIGAIAPVLLPIWAVNFLAQILGGRGDNTWQRWIVSRYPWFFPQPGRGWSLFHTHIRYPFRALTGMRLLPRKRDHPLVFQAAFHLAGLPC